MGALSDDELSAITDAARPLPPKVRSEFQAVAAEIEQQPQRGPGAIYPVVNCSGNVLIRRICRPPNTSLETLIFASHTFSITTLFRLWVR